MDPSTGASFHGISYLNPLQPWINYYIVEMQHRVYHSIMSSFTVEEMIASSYKNMLEAFTFLRLAWFVIS